MVYGKVITVLLGYGKSVYPPYRVGYTSMAPDLKAPALASAYRSDVEEVEARLKT